jgi:hypothetical protein
MGSCDDIRSSAMVALVVFAGCVKRFNEEYCANHGDDPRYAMYCPADASLDGLIPDGPPGTYRVVLTIDGLEIGSVVLEDNGGDDLTATTDGRVFFETPLAAGAPYDVTVKSQPAPQMCAVTDGTGVVGQADVELSVHCSGDPGIQCAATYCFVGDACCYVEGVCNSVTACTGVKLYCDDTADCSGPGVCCGEVKSTTQKKQAVCTATVAVCMAGDPGNEVLCDPAGDSACTSAQHCMPSPKFIGYHSCQ